MAVGTYGLIMHVRASLSLSLSEAKATRRHDIASVPWEKRGGVVSIPSSVLSVLSARTARGRTRCCCYKWRDVPRRRRRGGARVRERLN